MKIPLEDASVRKRLQRCALAVLAISATLLLGACDEEGGGIGMNVSLPGIGGNSDLSTPATDAGNVHWTGNPRW
jgi:hypothetical protein